MPTCRACSRSTRPPAPPATRGRPAHRWTFVSGPSYYQIRIGQNYRQINLEFPQPNEYYDRGSIQLLLHVHELYKRDDLVSDLFAYFRKRLANPPHQPGEVLDLRLALAYLHWWNGEKDGAVAELTAACELAPGDAGLRLELAGPRQRNTARQILAVLEGITPLDHTTMQRRKIAALRLSVRTGNVDRAREAADRLFGLRLDAETQVQLALRCISWVCTARPRPCSPPRIARPAARPPPWSA